MHNASLPYLFSMSVGAHPAPRRMPHETGIHLAQANIYLTG